MKNTASYLDEKQKRRSRRNLLIGLIYFMGVAVVAMFLFSLYSPGCAEFVKVFSVSLLLALACFVSGSFLGFLFGIPKINDGLEVFKKSRYKLNSNLTEISDWLTKIIIGLGLVELKDSYKFLSGASKSFARLMSCDHECPDSLTVYAFCCIIFFFVFGIYFGYNYVRLFLSKLYADADNSIMDSDLFNKVNNLDATTPEEAESKIESESEKFLFLEFMKESRAKIDEGRLLNSDDPQKGRWGENPVVGNRKLSAKVTPIPDNPELFRIKLVVSSTLESAPLKDNEIVIFNLHSTFNQPHKVAFVKDGQAVLNLVAYGAFTVGAIIVSEKVKLELDLVNAEGATAIFKER